MCYHMILGAAPAGVCRGRVRGLRSDDHVFAKVVRIPPSSALTAAACGGLCVPSQLVMTTAQALLPLLAV